MSVLMAVPSIALLMSAAVGMAAASSSGSDEFTFSEDPSTVPAIIAIALSAFTLAVIFFTVVGLICCSKKPAAAPHYGYLRSSAREEASRSEVTVSYDEAAKSIHLSDGPSVAIAEVAAADHDI